MAARERSGQRPRRRWVLTIACPIAVALALGAAALSGFSSDPEVLPRPNVVLFMTDDQPASTVMPETMPSLHELIIGPGTSFTDFIATTPLCCPSRAALMTGQYGHNNGVLNNNYANLIDKENVLPAWLQQAGYNTALIGKFLNGYERFAETPEQLGPGWDRWFVQLARRSYYNWTASKDGRLVSFGGADSDHATEVTGSLDRAAPRQERALLLAGQLLRASLRIRPRGCQLWILGGYLPRGRRCFQRFPAAVAAELQ